MFSLTFWLAIRIYKEPSIHPMLFVCEPKAIIVLSRPVLKLILDRILNLLRGYSSLGTAADESRRWSCSHLIDSKEIDGKEEQQQELGKMGNAKHKGKKVGIQLTPYLCSISITAGKLW